MVLQFPSPQRAIEEHSGTIDFSIEAGRLFPIDSAATNVLKAMGFAEGDKIINLPRVDRVKSCFG